MLKFNLKLLNNLENYFVLNEFRFLIYILETKKLTLLKLKKLLIKNNLNIETLLKTKNTDEKTKNKMVS